MIFSIWDENTHLETGSWWNLALTKLHPQALLPTHCPSTLRLYIFKEQLHPRSRRSSAAALTSVVERFQSVVMPYNAMWTAVVVEGASMRNWQYKQTGCKYSLMPGLGTAETNQATPCSLVNLRNVLRLQYGQTEFVNSVWPRKYKHDYTCSEWPHPKAGQKACCHSFPLTASTVEYWELISPYFLESVAEICSSFLAKISADSWHVSACLCSHTEGYYVLMPLLELGFQVLLDTLYEAYCGLQKLPTFPSYPLKNTI